MRGLTGETKTPSSLAGVRRWMYARERALVVAWLVVWPAFFAFVFVWGVWFRGLERVIDAWNSRTTPRLAEAEQLVAQKKWERATLALEQLDLDHPAVYVKHRLDKERERVLELLGQCFIETDHKKKAIDALQRLVAFDPRNWHNHFALAEALRHFDLKSNSEVAEAEYRQVLRIHPNHLPTVEILTGMLYDVAGLYAKVVDLHQQYLNASLIATVDLRVGDRTLHFDLPVDGNPHALEAPIELADRFSGNVTLSTRGYSAKIGELTFVEPERVGVASARARASVDGASGWTPTDAELRAPGQFAASSKDSHFDRSIEVPHGAGQVQLELTLYKHMTDDLWAKVFNSYGCRLEWDLREEAKRRTVVGGCLEAGSLFED
jgi:hypothetical protein